MTDWKRSFQSRLVRDAGEVTMYKVGTRLIYTIIMVLDSRGPAYMDPIDRDTHLPGIGTTLRLTNSKLVAAVLQRLGAWSTLADSILSRCAILFEFTSTF